jgi:hypothetical protein
VRNLGTRLDKLEVVWGAKSPPAVEVQEFVGEDGTAWVRIRCGRAMGWKAILKEAWEAV